MISNFCYYVLSATQVRLNKTYDRSCLSKKTLDALMVIKGSTSTAFELEASGRGFSKESLRRFKATTMGSLEKAAAEKKETDQQEAEESAIEIL